MVGRRISEGETRAQIIRKAGLDKTEKKIFRRFVLAEESMSQAEAAKRLRISQSSFSRKLRKMKDKLEGKETDRRKIRKSFTLEKVAIGVRELIDERISDGKKLEDIVRGAGLNETEIGILCWYVLAEELTSQAEAAKFMGLPLSTFNHRLWKMKERLERTGAPA